MTVAIPYERARAPRSAYLVAGGIALVAGLVGALSAGAPLSGVALAIVLLGAILTCAQPSFGVFAVVGLLWANIPTVIAREHGVPVGLAGAYILALLVPAAQQAVRQGRLLRATSAMPWVGAYFAVALLSAVRSEYPERSLGAVRELALEGLLIFFLATQAVRDRRTARQAAWALLGAGAFMGSIVLLQQVTGRFDSNFGGFGLVDSGFSTSEVTTRGRVSQPRLSGPIGEKNRFGQVMLCVVALGVGFAPAARRLSGRGLVWGAAGIAAVGAALTFSRGNALAFALVVPLMLMLRTVTKRQVGLVVVACGLLLLALPQYRERLATVGTALSVVDPGADAGAADGAIRGRVTQMLAAAFVFIDYPVLGVGPNNFPAYAQEYGNPLGLRRLEEEREAHSLFPEVAAEVGTLGLVAFLALLGVTLRDLLRGVQRSRSRADRALFAAFFLALVAYLSAGLFLHMSFIRYFWMLFGLASAVGALAVERIEPADEAVKPLTTEEEEAACATRS